MIRIGGIVLLLGILCSPTVCEAQYGGFLDSNAEFLSACEGRGDEGRVLCLRYMHRAVDSVFEMARGGAWSDFCPPNRLDDEALRAIIIRFLKSDPHAAMYRPPDSAVMALLGAWKCSK